MPEFQDFDAIPWINSHLNGAANLDFEQLKPILCFALLWNMFESKACDKNANQHSIIKSVQDADGFGLLKIERYEPILNFFKHRYVTFNTINDNFLGLQLTNQAAKKIVNDVLIENYFDLNNVVSALLLITHRIRNNLFHGNKNVESLPNQTDLFVMINFLLSRYLEDIVDMTSQGRQRNVRRQRSGT